MSTRKKFPFYRYETSSERNTLRCFFGNANNSQTVSHLVLKGRCGITSIPTFIIAPELIALGWSLASSCWRSTNFTDLPQRMRLVRGFNFWRAVALILELIFVHFTMNPRWMVPLYSQMAWRTFSSSRKGLFFSFRESLDDDIYGFSFPCPNDTLNSRHL